jgi:energy-coupling factor transporter ATP-binding protein EcfA2
MKTQILIFFISIGFTYAQSPKIEAIVQTSENSIQTAVRAEMKDTTSFYNRAVLAINRSKKGGYGIFALHSGFGNGVYSSSVSGEGIIGTSGYDFGIVTTASGSNTPVGVLGIGADTKIGVEGYSEEGIGGYFSSDNGTVGLVSMNNVGILTKTPAYPLSFSEASGDKISFSGGVTNNTTNHFGIGIQNAQFQLFTPTINDDILFGIGRSSDFIEKVRIKGTGSVGIGVTNPDGMLDVNGRVRLRHNGSTSGLWMSNSTNSISVADGAFYGMKQDTETGIWIGNAWRFWINNLGNGTFSGTVTASNFINSSDIRFKKNIIPLRNSLSDIQKINGVRYDWKKDEFPERKFSDKNQIGFIAQEIEKIFPEMVFTDEKGYKSVEYARLTPVLVEAIKELIVKNEQLESQNNKLENRVSKIETLIARGSEKSEK